MAHSRGGWARAVVVAAAAAAMPLAAARSTVFDCTANASSGGSTGPYSEIDLNDDCDEATYSAEGGVVAGVVLAAVSLLFCLSWWLMRSYCNLCGGLTINRDSCFSGKDFTEFDELDERAEQQKYAHAPHNCFDGTTFAKALVVFSFLLAIGGLVLSATGTVQMKNGLDDFWDGAHTQISLRTANVTALSAEAISPSYAALQSMVDTWHARVRSHEDDMRDALGKIYVGLGVGFAAPTCPIVCIVLCCAVVGCGRNGPCGCNGRGLVCTIVCILSPVVICSWLIMGAMSGVHAFADDFCTEVDAIAAGSGIQYADASGRGYVGSYVLYGLCTELPGVTCAGTPPSAACTAGLADLRQCGSTLRAVATQFKPDCDEWKNGAIQWLISMALASSALAFAIGGSWLGIKRFFFVKPAPEAKSEPPVQAAAPPSAN